MGLADRVLSHAVRYPSSFLCSLSRGGSLGFLSLAVMANYDLTPRIAPHFDRHLVFPLLEFLHERQLYADEEILKAKIELLNNTNMVDYAMDIHKNLYNTEEVPQDMVDRRVEVVARLISLEEAAAPLISFLQNPNSFQELRTDKQYNLQMLNDRFQVRLSF
ncbi:hypothetical protein HHK36_017808 [Tetracentron sinense]|uniref:Eukaryotic translation initiation factor 3 subunit E N-terminal domain-containing protein n=1 Tax=Tetracentron sinense TaxID=13715 RepID=A0A834YYT5_TETSI|nr:hypothetical protein HHK36_017808 [Tetracentron sinense]